VGGDLYDVIQLGEDRFGVMIADVSDKGMPAALYMALTRSLFRAEAKRGASPRNTLEALTNSYWNWVSLICSSVFFTV